MVNHSVRTAFWTLAVLHQHQDELDPATLETSWVAALLHDVGLENPPAAGGDFSLGGIEVLERLAARHHWPDAQVHAAREAIATNLSARVDRERSGVIAWAMNVGGVGELGFRWHRQQMHPDRIAELEARYPRTDLVPTSKRLIRAEAKRVRGGRFGFFRYLFPIVLRARPSGSPRPAG
jgi:predicted dienelactone hydrolase